jgi:hypothetical protein
MLLSGSDLKYLDNAWLQRREYVAPKKYSGSLFRKTHRMTRNHKYTDDRGNVCSNGKKIKNGSLVFSFRWRASFGI